MSRGRVRSMSRGQVHGPCPRSSPPCTRSSPPCTRSSPPGPAGLHPPLVQNATNRTIASVNGEDGQFEEPILRLRRRIEELATLPEDAPPRKEIERLREKLVRVSREIYASLTPWQKTLVARHPARPYTLDYIEALMTDFAELHGDRRFGDDPALVCGFAFYKERPVAVIGHQKG